MNIVEKRIYIYSHLHLYDDALINEIYNRLNQEEILQTKLTSRAEKAMQDIKEGRIFTREEAEQRLSQIKSK